MQKPNYQFEKRRKELDKKAKKDGTCGKDKKEHKEGACGKDKK